VSALVRGAIMEISTYRPEEEKEIQRCVTMPRFPRDPRGGEKGDKVFRCFVIHPDNFSSLSTMRLSCREFIPSIYESKVMQKFLLKDR